MRIGPDPLDKRSSCQCPDGGDFCGGDSLSFPRKSHFCLLSGRHCYEEHPFQSKSTLVWVINVRVTLAVCKATVLGVSIFTFYSIQNGGLLSEGSSHPDGYVFNHEMTELSKSRNPSWLRKESGLCVRTPFLPPQLCHVLPL